MTLDQIFENRYSVRAFCDRPVKDQDILAICEAARVAPSACNSQTWRFVAVQSKPTIGRICHEAMRPVIPNRWLSQAPLLIVGCSDLDITANRIGSRISGIDYYQIDLGIAMEHMVLKATELGIGSCWIGWFSQSRLKEILKIPARIRVPALLALGYPDDRVGKRRRSKRKPLEKILYFEGWKQPYNPAR